MNNEIWVDIQGYQGIYQVSDCGRVKTTCLVHRLVAEAFIENPDSLPNVNHKNGLKNDNVHFNLEWTTRSQNQKHANTKGLQKVKIGEGNPKSKLTEKEVSEIKLLLKEGNLFQRDIAKLYCVGQCTISAINQNKRWSHVK